MSLLMTKQLTFKDIKREPRGDNPDALSKYRTHERWSLNLGKGRSLSVLKWLTFYSNWIGSYEVWVKLNGKLDYTHTDGDVLWHQTEEQINELIIKIQSLSFPTEPMKLSKIQAAEAALTEAKNEYLSTPPSIKPGDMICVMNPTNSYRYNVDRVKKYDDGDLLLFISNGDEYLLSSYYVSGSECGTYTILNKNA